MIEVMEKREMKIIKIKKEEVWPIRHKVMWPSKSIEFIKLKEDNNGKHYGLYEREELISVVSLFYNEREVQFRKFATIASMQNKGYGSKLLNYIFNQAKQIGVKRIWCNARKSKMDFYRRFGMTHTNKTFEKEGISYVVMEKIF